MASHVGPFVNLRSFLDHLDAHGELAKVKAEVDPVLEVAAVADRVMKSPAPRGHDEVDRHVHADKGGRALLFQNVRGSDMPICINAFGSYRRIEEALGTPTLEHLAARVEKFVKPQLPATLYEKFKLGKEVIGDLSALLPKKVKDAPCQAVVRTGKQVDLNRLPVIQCWPHDGDIDSGEVFSHLAADLPAARQRPRTGRYITLGGIYTTHPETGDKNIGMYRVQVFDHNTCAMHWHVHHDGARHFRAWQKKGVGGEPMPVAVVLGGSSVMPYAATAPLPPGIPEVAFASFLNQKRIEMVQCVSHDLEVPAEAEIIIEGFVHPTETLVEGPFGDHTGFYSLADRYPRFDVTAITTRTDPIYPTTIVGKPPMEDYFLGKATERVFLPLLKTIVPDILDYALPMAGCFHNCVYVKIKKEYAYQARRVMHAIWGAGQMSFTKFIVVVDEDVDVHDEQAVLFHLFANCDPARDTETVRGPVDILDHASPGLGVGSKMGFDATRKLAAEAGESVVRDWPLELEFDQATRDMVDRRWAEYGLS
jgi:4-hydroxy-3-polyprenylbenzoate decarboxylase